MDRIKTIRNFALPSYMGIIHFILIRKRRGIFASCIMTLFFLMMNINHSKAQETVSSQVVDKISYQLFELGYWTDLIDYAEDAIVKGENFYYLQIRLGIAYYELKEYRQALYHFEKAKTLQAPDDVLNEYLYYCYIYNNQYEQALKLSKHFNKHLLDATATNHPSIIIFANIEGGTKIPSDTFYKPMYYTQTGLTFRAGRNMTAYAAYTYITQKNYYATLQQQQYYLTVNIPLAHSWLLSPAVHVLSYSFSEVNPLLSLSAASPIVAGLSAQKNYKNFKCEVRTSYSNLSNEKQYMQHIEVTHYPLSDNTIAFNSGISFLSNDSSGKNSFHTLVNVGAKYYPLKKLSLSASYLYANTKNFNEQNAYLVNNSGDETGHRINVNFDWSFSKHMSLYGIYFSETKTESYTQKAYGYNAGILGLKMIF